MAVTNDLQKAPESDAFCEPTIDEKRAAAKRSALRDFFYNPALDMSEEKQKWWKRVLFMVGAPFKAKEPRRKP